MYFKCCIPNCASKREEAKLHKFPSAEDQRNKWLEFINCDNLKRMHSSNLVKMLVCHKHFEKRFHTAKSGIKMTAYPTLFSLEEIESGFSSQSNNEQENVLVDHTYTRKRHYDHTYYKIEHHSPLLKAQDPLIDLTNIPSTSFAPLSHLDNVGNVSDFTDIPSTSFAPLSHLDNLGNVSDFTDIPSTSFAPLSHVDNLGNVSDFTDIPSTSFAPLSHLDNLGNGSGELISTTPKKVVKKRLVQKFSKLSPQHKLLYSKFKKSRRQLNYNVRVRRALAFSKDHAFEKMTGKMNPLAKKFFYMQIKMCRKKKKGRRFSLEEKLIALSIMKQSPKAYRFLQKMFILPSNTTLKKMITELDVKAGI